MGHSLFTLRIKFSAPLAGVILLGSAASAYAILPSGSDSELFVTGVASVQENDNVFLSHTGEKSDTIFDLVPGLSYEYGKNSLTNGKVAISEDWQTYASESKLNTGLFNALGTLNYSDDKLKLDALGSYAQADQATRDVRQVGTLVKRDLYHAEGKSEWVVTEKTSVGVGAIYDDTEYKKAGYVNWQWTEIPLNYYYKVEPKVDLSAGFRYRNNQLGAGGIDSNDYFYNVGARGEFTPKLTGTFTIGYNRRELSSGKSRTEGGLGIDSTFTYDFSPKTTVNFGVSNDYGYAAVGSAYRLFGINGGFNTQVNEIWSLHGQASYNRYDYTTSTQQDDFYQAGAGATYTLNRNASFTGGYSFVKDNSNITSGSFNNNIFSVSATLHY